MEGMEGVILLLGIICTFSEAQGNIRPYGPLLIQAGKDAVFRWTTENGNEILAVTWGLQRGSTFTHFMYFSKTKPPVDTKRYSFVGNITIGRAWFQLSNVLINDTGYYVAKITEKGVEEIDYEAYLQVAATPKFIEKPGPSTSVIENAELKINCTATGPPKPNVTWVEVSKGGSLTLKAYGRGSAMLREDSITKTSQGRIFICQARNNPSQYPENVTTTITVYYPPEIGKTFEQESYCIGDIVRLVCSAAGNPEPIVTWKGPSGQKVDSSGDLTMKEDKNFGNYTCVAKNLVGSASYVLRLVKTNVSCQPPVTKPTPSPTDDVHPGIIAGVVIAAILAIAGLIIAIIFWRRRKLYMKDSENRNERSVRMNAVGDDDNVYATTQQANREAPGRAQPTVQYAAVDKSKKTKKKIPGEGELIYADLDHETPADERPPSDRRSTGASGEQPTLYADISSARQEAPRYGNLQDMDFM